TTSPISRIGTSVGMAGRSLADEPRRPSCVPESPRTSLLVLERHVLIGGPDRQWNKVDRVIGDPRSDPDQHSRAPDRREHHAIKRELLDAVEQGLPLRGVPLPRLLLEQVIYVGIAAVGVTPLGVDERLHSRGGIA